MADEKLVNQVEDQELNDLLDSALKDFNKEQKVSKADDNKESLELPADKNTFKPLEDAWTADFIEEAADQFEENLQNVIKNGIDGDLAALFKKKEQTIGSNVTSDEKKVDKESVNADFETAIARALNDLFTTSETLQNETDLSEMLEQTSLEEGPGTVLLVIQRMLQHLLSKEILYPSLKELVDKYPEWLEGKKTALSSNDLQKFTKQLELMKQVCTELEKEKVEDTEETKKKRFDMMISLMQEIQGCGELPEELVGEQTMPFQFNADGDPVIPALLRGLDSSQNCRLM